MPKLTINGKDVEVPPGTNLIEAARLAGFAIPHYCYHPGLSIAGQCRLCMVDIEKTPRPTIACNTLAADGMVVNTETDRVKETRRSIMEFHLINHPLDCPVCDQAGECWLQIYYMRHGLYDPRMTDEKVHKPKAVPLGPHVMLNAERCIVCTRCIRFMEEVAGVRQLGVFNRGDRSEIGTFPGQPLDNPYALNTVDVCPVGALTSTVFRFKQRVWDLKRSASICPGCGRGCNVHVDQRAAQVDRLLPRDNDAVNQSWLCDEGRLTYSRANDDRLSEAMLKGDGGVRSVPAGDALKQAILLLKPIAEARQAVGVALSLNATCEEAYTLGRVAKEVLGAGRVTLLERAAGEADKLLRVADRNPNRAGVLRVLLGLGLAQQSRDELERQIASGAVKALLVVGHEVDDAAGFAEACERLEVLVHIGHAASPLCERAHVTLPSLSWVQLDGTWVNVDGRAQRLSPAFAATGHAKPAHAWLQELAAALGVSFPWPSVQTIRAEMERTLPTFKDAQLAEVGPFGRILPN
ncbi:MAG: (2Fe-2S)-binding protein [Deltaproteobacteria bacterium]|nr:(2Fe-2S)-binding protein [Deltaproteobacteria bacterium]